MTNIEQAIKFSIEGGWMHKFLKENDWCLLNNNVVCFSDIDTGQTTADISIYEILLDKNFWICLGKKLGWGILVCINCRVAGWTKENECKNCNKGGIGIKKEDYIFYWHSFIDALSRDETPEQFFEGLLK